MRWIVLIAVAVVSASTPVTARADRRDDDARATRADKRARAKAHFERAEVFKRHGDEHAAAGDDVQARGAYERAAAEYVAAYELTGHPALLFNLGQVHNLSGKRWEAVRAYERYLELAPDGPGAADARVFIAEIRQRLREDTHRAATGDAPSLTPRPAPSPAPAPSIAPAEPGVPDDEPDRARGRPLRIVGLTTVAVGAASLGFGVKLGLDARAASDDLSAKSGAWTADDRARVDDGRRAERRMIVAYSIGGAAIIGGAVMYYAGRRAGRERRSRIAIRPAVGSSTAAVLISGSF